MAAQPASPPSLPAPVEAPVEEEDVLEDLDFFEDSLESLFQETMPARGDPLKLFTYTPPSSSSVPPLTCRIPPQQVNSLFAHHVWSASLKMADALAEGRLRVEGEDVLEMGAGAGIPGLMAARMGARKVVISDYDDPALIANLNSNIPLAFPDAPDIQARIIALGHSWGEEESLQALIAANSSHPFTHILLADTLWYSSAHHLLLSSLVRLLRLSPASRIHVCAGFHSGRSTVRSFLRKAREVGLVRRGRWEEVGYEGERREWGWDLKKKEGEGKREGAVGEEEAAEEWEEKENGSERNKWVVEGELGWSDEKLGKVEHAAGVAAAAK